MASSNPDHLPKARPPNTITLRVRASTYEFCGDKIIQSIKPAVRGSQVSPSELWCCLFLKTSPAKGSTPYFELRSSVEMFIVIAIKGSSKTFSSLLRTDYLSYTYIPTPISLIHQQILRYPPLSLYTHTHTQTHTTLDITPYCFKLLYTFAYQNYRDHA